MGGLGSGRLSKELEEKRKVFEEALNKPSVFAEVFLGVKPFDYQRKFLDDNSRLKLFVGGRKVGKSLMTAVLALYHALTREEAEVLVIAPTMRQSSILFEKMRKLVHDSEIFEYLLVRETKTMMEFVNESKIYALPAGRTGDTIRGFSPTLIIFDEAAYIPDQVFKAVIPAGMASQAKMIMISTPVGKHGYFYEAFQSGKWAVYRAKSFDNPLVKGDPDFLDIVQRMTKDMYKQEVLGEFVEFGKAFFGQSIVLNSFVENLLVPSGGEVYIGADIARFGNDSTVFAVARIVEDTVYIEAFFEYERTAITEVAEMLYQLWQDTGAVKVFVDETGLGGGAMDMLIERGVPVEGVTFSNKKKLEMYQRVKWLMESGKLKMVYNEKAIQQFLSIETEPTSTGRVRFISSTHDDFVDAVALATEGYSKPDQVHILDPGLFDMIF